jgi:hypothetical protein
VLTKRVAAGYEIYQSSKLMQDEQDLQDAFAAVSVSVLGLKPE